MLDRFGLPSFESFEKKFQTEPKFREQLSNDPRSNWGTVGQSAGITNPNEQITPYMSMSKYGGMYEEGGSYELSDDEIQNILAAGGQIEYLD